MTGRQSTMGTLGLMRGRVQLVLKQGWQRDMTERGEDCLPPPHTRLRLLGTCLKAAGGQHHFSQGRERPCRDLCFQKLILAAGWKGCRWQVGEAGGEEAGRESGCGDSEASTASWPLANSKSNQLPPERGLQFSPRSQSLSRQRRDPPLGQTQSPVLFPLRNRLSWSLIQSATNSVSSLLSAVEPLGGAQKAGTINIPILQMEKPRLWEPLAEGYSAASESQAPQEV